MSHLRERERERKGERESGKEREREREREREIARQIEINYPIYKHRQSRRRPVPCVSPLRDSLWSASLWYISFILSLC